MASNMEGLKNLSKVVNDIKENSERRQSILEERQTSFERNLTNVEKKIDRLLQQGQQGSSVDQGEVNTSFAEEENSISLDVLGGNKSVDRETHIVDTHLVDAEGKGMIYFCWNV